jgi:preprotein translocase subunit SecG
MVIHFFCAAAIVALVLLQRGKGAEAGAGFGAGASGTVFGARGATTALSRATAVLAAIFMITSLSLAYVGSRKGPAAENSLLDQPVAPRAPTAAPGIVPLAPGAASSGGAAAPENAPAPSAAPAAPAPTTGTGSATSAAPTTPAAPTSSSQTGGAAGNASKAPK